LTLTYVGTINALRLSNRSTAVHTPNNNENRGHCANEVGHQDGKYCISRTPLSMATTAPRFFQNARHGCNGGGCPWTSVGPVSISGDGLTVQSYRDNWGSDVDAILFVDEYEHVGAAQCGNDRPVPVVRGQPVVFAAVKECLPIATIKWTLLPDKSEGTFRFGDKASQDGKVAMDGSLLDNNTIVLASYMLAK
jgi:hypothetical protein